VSVSIDRMMYPDGVYRAAFSTDGACALATDAVQVLEATCGDSTVTDASRGTVRMAKLGFDAFRRVDAGRADVPLLETTAGAAPEQFDLVRIQVKEPGDFRVEITGRPVDGLDPRPIEGSASSGGQISGRSAVWTIPNAQPGLLDFSVRFAPGAVPGSTVSYVPEVTVARTAPASLLLDHVGAPPPPMSPVAVQRTSTLVMRQHVAPASGPPLASSQPFIPTDDRLPTAFETSAALDGAGAYYATASGRVTATSVGHLDDIAPGALGAVDTLGITTSRPWIPGADKIEARPGITEENDQWTGFDLQAQTPLASDVTLLVPPGPLAGVFWDGDVAVAGAVASIGSVGADRPGQPTNGGGRLTMDWDGSAATAWSGLWANNVPFGEPNKLNYAEYKRDVENAALGAIGYPGGYGPFSVVGMTEASIPVVVQDGDLDTRGRQPVVGDPVQVRVPQGHTFGGAFTFTVWMEETAYDYELDSGPEGMTITPIMGRGGVWLESTQDGYARDWSNLHMVSVFSSEMNRNYDGEVLTQAALVVPSGAVGAVDVVDLQGVREHRELTPGLWTATVTPEGLNVVRTAPEG
jgi:hypothetical protein